VSDDLNGRLQAGIEQAQRGETHDLGDFVPYIDDEQVRVTARPDGTAMIWLPSVDYLDTIGGYSAEVAISREHAMELFQALGKFLCTHEQTDYEVFWRHGFDQKPSPEEAREFAREKAAEHPGHETYARYQVGRTFADGSEWYGPWLRLDPETKEEQA
jgi:hypothetical protein